MKLGCVDFLYFCGMKKRLLRFGSLLMTFVVLFVSMGWNVKFHYCTEDHHLTSSLGEAVESCLHCLEHEHEHEASFVQHDVIQFNAKCCCKDFESKIQFTDNYVFSAEKHLDIHFQPFAFVHFDHQDLMLKAKQVFQHFTAQKIPYLHIGRIGLIFFSQLKLNPLVF